MTPEVARLLAPDRLYSWADLVTDKNCPPSRPGTYAWYFYVDALPSIIPTDRAHRIDQWVLLYVGIAPSQPAAGRAPSRRSLRTRIRFHFRGNARGSTLRLSLGCILADSLGLVSTPVGKGTRVAFGEGEALLSQWMASHARVCWVEHPSPWEMESDAIGALNLPLNLAGNRRHPFHSRLSELRRTTKYRLP